MSHPRLAYALGAAPAEDLNRPAAAEGLSRLAAPPAQPPAVEELRRLIRRMDDVLADLLTLSPLKEQSLLRRDAELVRRDAANFLLRLR